MRGNLKGASGYRFKRKILKDVCTTGRKGTANDGSGNQSETNWISQAFKFADDQRKGNDCPGHLDNPARDSGDAAGGKQSP